MQLACQKIGCKYLSRLGIVTAAVSVRDLSCPNTDALPMKYRTSGLHPMRKFPAKGSLHARSFSAELVFLKLNSSEYINSQNAILLCIRVGSGDA
jgi:hypothetical protein